MIKRGLAWSAGCAAARSSARWDPPKARDDDRQGDPIYGEQTVRMNASVLSGMSCLNLASAIFLFAATLVGVSRSVSAQEALVLSSIEGSVNAAIGEAILAAAYNRIGLAVRFELLPAKRAIRDVSTGETDGEVQRIAEFADDRPNLVRVDIPLFTVNAYVYALDERIAQLDRENLSRLRIGVRSGIKFVEDYVRGFETVFSIRKNEQLPALLFAERIDAFIQSELNAKLALNDAVIGREIFRSENPIRKLILYHYLNKRQFGIVPTIEGVLKEMRDEGTTLAIIDETLLSLNAATR